MKQVGDVVNYKYLEEVYGYKRYKCKVCGGYFWSTIPRETCPDRPCSKYEFLYKSYKRVLPLSIKDVREKFINFLARKGHGVVDPYPVLAKWRNDLYLTIASIVVFQPVVTDGVADPPHNPLVIVQPSIRLTDIDNVGLTFGRHLTSFEMGGMHAFNKQGKIIYWSEGIFENTIEFFNKEIGIDLDDLVFKEGWWEGGGNAGPAPEVLVDGMELATLVHMAYKTVNGKLELNPVLVVDCGYGVERIAWFTQKTPTGFHAVYGRLVDTYKDVLGVEEPPHDVLKKLVYELSDKEIASIDELVKYLEGTAFAEHWKGLVNSIYLYSALDHVRTLLLMLSDGIVPSNSGEGYLARLVIRRLLRNLIKLGIEHHRLGDVVLELIDKQISYWKGDYIYGKFEKHRDYITDVVSLEVVKFVNALQRGIEVVEGILKRKKRLEVEDLVEIYDSHGIPPDIVVERAKEYGISIETPPNFYSIIASRHSAPRILVKERERELPEEVVKWASGFKATRLLFHEDPYLTRTEATVLGVKDNYVVLDKTVAYPWAGGQDHDEGYLIFGDKKYKIVYVGKAGDVVVHVLDKVPEFSLGDYVLVEIDWRRRYQLMKHHTATHIVLAAARKVLGEHVWQAGAEKTPVKARLDITHHKPLTEEEVRKIEDLANEIVNSRIELRFNYLTRFEAENRYGLKIYQGGAVYSPTLRIVEIPGWDAQACFGTHLHSTSEVGGIKITNVERIQDGVIRLEFIAGTKLVEMLRSLEEEISSALSILGSKQQNLVEAVKRVQNEHAKASELLRKYREALEKVLVSQALSNKTKICDIEATYIELPFADEKLVKRLLEELSISRGLLTVISSGDTIEVAISPEKAKSLGINLRKVVDALSEKGVKGGGKQDHITMRRTGELTIEKLFEVLKSTLCT